jgi:hypothetical protein
MLLRPSQTNQQKVQHVSYLHEIDDNNVLNALREIRRRAGAGAMPPVKPNSSSPYPQRQLESISEEKKEMDDSIVASIEMAEIEPSSIQAGHSYSSKEMPSIYSDSRIEHKTVIGAQRKQPSPSTSTKNSSSSWPFQGFCGEADCLNGVLTRSDACDESCLDGVLTRSGPFDDDKGVLKADVRNRLQQLSANNRMLVGTTGSIDDNSIFYLPADYGGNSGSPNQTLARSGNLPELMPMLALVDKVREFLFRGKYDVLQLHSIFQLLHRIEDRLQSSNDYRNRTYSQRGVDDKVDLHGITKQMKRVTKLIVAVTGDFLDDHAYSATIGEEESTLAGWSLDDALTLDETLSLTDSLTLWTLPVPHYGTGMDSADRGAAVIVPAISSFIDFKDDSTIDRTPRGKTLEIVSTPDEDDSTATYDFTVAGQQITESAQTAQEQSHEASSRVGSPQEPQQLQSSPAEGVEIESVVESGRKTSVVFITTQHTTANKPGKPSMGPRVTIAVIPNVAEKDEHRERWTSLVRRMSSAMSIRSSRKDRRPTNGSTKNTSTANVASASPILLLSNATPPNPSPKPRHLTDAPPPNSKPQYLTDAPPPNSKLLTDAQTTKNRQVNRQVTSKLSEKDQWIQSLYLAGKRYSTMLPENFDASKKSVDKVSKSLESKGGSLAGESFLAGGIPRSLIVHSHADDNCSLLSGVGDMPEHFEPENCIDEGTEFCVEHNSKPSRRKWRMKGFGPRSGSRNIIQT